MLIRLFAVAYICSPRSHSPLFNNSRAISTGFARSPYHPRTSSLPEQTRPSYVGTGALGPRSCGSANKRQSILGFNSLLAMEVVAPEMKARGWSVLLLMVSFGCFPSVSVHVSCQFFAEGTDLLVALDRTSRDDFAIQTFGTRWRRSCTELKVIQCWFCSEQHATVSHE